MEVKLDSGMKVVVKQLSVDEKDSLLDPIEWKTDDKGNTTGCVNQFSTATKWIRACILKFCPAKSKEFIDLTEKTLPLLSGGDKLEIFTALFVRFNSQGEEKAS